MMWLEVTSMTLAKRQKQIYDARVKANQYVVGDLVWMEIEHWAVGYSPKAKGPL